MNPLRGDHFPTGSEEVSVSDIIWRISGIRFSLYRLALAFGSGICSDQGGDADFLIGARDMFGSRNGAFLSIRRSFTGLRRQRALSSRTLCFRPPCLARNSLFIEVCTAGSDSRQSSDLLRRGFPQAEILRALRILLPCRKWKTHGCEIKTKNCF